MLCSNIIVSLHLKDSQNKKGHSEVYFKVRILGYDRVGLSSVVPLVQSSVACLRSVTGALLHRSAENLRNKNEILELTETYRRRHRTAVSGTHCLLHEII